MRRVNKKIVILSIILATVFLNNPDVSAAAVKKVGANKNYELIQSNKTAIENSLKNNDYNLFTTTLASLNITENITNDQFAILVNAYNLFKNNKKADAIKLLEDNKLNPVLIKMISSRPDLTDAQKEILKQASDLVKQGKITEAKALISSAGLPQAPLKIDKKINKLETKANKDELKKAFEQARQLKQAGDLDGAKKVLNDAGVPALIQDKIGAEFNPHDASSTASSTKKIGFFQSLKNLFLK